VSSVVSLRPLFMLPTPLGRTQLTTALTVDADRYILSQPMICPIAVQ
jgi:hypothetical protein